MNRTIALVEDDEVIRANYADMLRLAGFAVNAYASKEEAIAGIEMHRPDLVLLDITLNGERDAGYDVCAELRRRSESLPIVFLTNHDAEMDKISGLRLGADDYVTKDVSDEYLIVRLEALFRRRSAQLHAHTNAPQAQRDGTNDQHLIFDDVASTAKWRGQRLQLPLTQYWILRDLFRAAGQPRSHQELMRAAKIVVETNTITVHIKAIRAEFQRIDPKFDRIVTERGRGYRWLPD
jgi:two-component system OmpR family response regulator